jgi:hypothetical protein
MNIVLFALISLVDSSTIRYYDKIIDCHQARYVSPHTECVIIKIPKEKNV